MGTEQATKMAAFSAETAAGGDTAEEDRIKGAILNPTEGPRNSPGVSEDRGAPNLSDEA